MEGDYSATGPCVCGFGEEFFTMEGERTVCTVCGGIVGKYVPDLGPSTAQKPKKTILIVDDQAFFRERISRVLKDHGHEVLESADGLGAVSVVRDIYVKRKSKLSTRLDAFVLDLIMPGDLDGFQTLAVVKTLLPEVPVIILTASLPKPDLLQKLAKLGAKKYLNKSAANLDSLIAKNIQEI